MFPTFLTMKSSPGRLCVTRLGSTLLSPQEIQGLFGELKFLEECIDAGRVSMQAAVEGWVQVFSWFERYLGI